MASGMYSRIRKFSIPFKMYGFESVDKERESEIVERLSRNTHSSRIAFDDLYPKTGKTRPPKDRVYGRSKTPCDKLHRALDGEHEHTHCTDDDEHRHTVLAEEKYAEYVFKRLGKTHTFSSKSKQRDVDPLTLDPETFNDSSSESSAGGNSRPSSGHPHSFKAFAQTAFLTSAGLGKIFNLGHEKEKKEEEPKFKWPGGPGGATTIKALGKFKFQGNRDEIEKARRLRLAQGITSDYEILNAHEFVRKYERENAREVRLRQLGRPTTASKWKRFNRCPLCEESSCIAEDWMKDKVQVCGKCRRNHHETLDVLYNGKKAPRRRFEQPQDGPDLSDEEQEEGEEERREEAGEEAETERQRKRRQIQEQQDLIERVRVPTRASEGGQPFCERTGSIKAIGYTVNGIPRPKSAVDRIRSSKKKKQAIEMITERLYRPKSSKSMITGYYM